MGKNIAIDGPAGAGKSTIARAAASKLGFIYVDTGALYRSIGLYCLNNNIETTDRTEVERILPDISVQLKYLDGVQRVILNDNDVSEEIRKPECSMAASNVSAIPVVREFLFELQRKMARENDVIMDGRDIGTVILPDAEVKIFLTASPEERANRRFKELIEKGNNPDYDELLKEINQRDYNDMHRETAPLKQADDAILFDTTTLGKDEVVDELLKIISGKLGDI
ncbi:MAG: (d)CMP kinase [Oscillospiraceae bacterium]|nr:(d)CMP kinase [Oscillospiraceae bacterium]